MKILVTAFDPFGGESVNPALEAVKKLENHIDNHEIIKLEIPTVFHRSASVLKEKIEEIHPDIVLCVGQAGGRYGLTVERVAINIDDARIPDNDGNQPIDTPIHTDGEPAYFSTLPVKAMVDYIKRAEIPASLSNTAGTFVCNHIMYQALYYAQDYHYKAGFIHVPFLNEQVLKKPNTPSMNEWDIVKGLTAAIHAIVDYDEKEDLKTILGTTH